MTRCIWVSLPYATFGLVADGERIVMAPPIARWAVGRSKHEVTDYYRRRGAQFRRVPELQEKR